MCIFSRVSSTAFVFVVVVVFVFFFVLIVENESNELCGNVDSTFLEYEQQNWNVTNKNVCMKSKAGV